MNILEVRDLTVRFGQRGGGQLTAVDGLSLTLREGHTLALVGESGSGKSTVVKALSRLLRPDAGELLLHGEPVRGGRSALRAYRRAVQVVFQDPFASLNPMHTVDHHLRRPLLLSPDRPRGTAAVTGAVHDLLRSVNLDPPADFAAKHPHELSGGQRQRVAIARALAPAPQVLLADEPVSMLDVSIRLEILNLLDRLKRERDLALLYVTHDLATARHFAGEIMVMYRGEVVEHGRSDDVILRPAHPYTRLLASAAPDPGRSRAELAEARSARLAVRAAEQRVATVAGGCRFRNRCAFAMDVCHTRPPNLPAAPGHTARCWLFDESATARPA
ncbi:MAG TPA: ABC transporter ATP-binding protein [Pseudonocardiaceae bacterium]|nr:ABC transporter ATP-binding protein [Pseudonocardiaceae bacterium]